MFKWKIRGDPRSYGGSSRAAANDGGDGAGVTIHTYIHTYIHTINVNKVGQQLMHLLLLLLLLALLLLEVGRNLMHLEMFVQRDSNLRDDQMEELHKGFSRVDTNLTTFKIRHEEHQEKLDTYLGN